MPIYIIRLNVKITRNFKYQYFYQLQGVRKQIGIVELPIESHPRIKRSAQ